MGVRLILIRHGESTLGKKHRYAGHLDTFLTALGRRQVLQLRHDFEKTDVYRIFSSDLRRCRQTSGLLAPGRKIEFTDRLRELHFGTWEGRTSEECSRRCPERYARWMRDPVGVAPPEGETLRRLSRRVRTFVSSLVRRYPGRTLALITHAGPIRVLLAPDLNTFWSKDVPTGSRHEVVWNKAQMKAFQPRGRCVAE